MLDSSSTQPIKEKLMLFMVTYEIAQEKLRETQIQFSTQEEN